MKKTAFLSDILFAFFASSIFSLCLFRFLGTGLVLSSILALICGALLACSVWAMLTAKRKKYFLKKEDETKKEKLLLHLALLDAKEATKLFSPLLQGKLLQERFIQTERELFFIHCDFAPLTLDEIATFFRLPSEKEKTVYCAKADGAALALCDKLAIKLKTERDIYLLFKEHNALPTKFLGDFQRERLPFFKRKGTFAKSNSQRFLVSGCFLLLSSLITPFPYYYLIFGTILLLTATFTRIFGQ